MKKIIYTDCLHIQHTIENVDLEKETEFVTDTNGTRIAALFIIEGLLTGKTKVIK